MNERDPSFAGVETDVNKGQKGIPSYWRRNGQEGTPSCCCRNSVNEGKGRSPLVVEPAGVTTDVNKREGGGSSPAGVTNSPLLASNGRERRRGITLLLAT